MPQSISMKPIMLAVTALALAGCEPRSDAAAGVAVPTAAEAGAIVDAAEAAWNSADTAKIMVAYKEGGVWFDPVAAAPSADRAVQTKWTDSFTALKLSEMKVADKAVQVLDADTIVASGIATFTSAAQADPVTFRYTDVYEKQADGKWLIVHEHLSAPPAEAVAAAATG